MLGTIYVRYNLIGSVMKSRVSRFFKSDVARASVWTTIAFGFSQLLRLFSNLILTRLLLPEIFGLMAIVTVIRVGVYMCSEIGLKVNIIRHDKGENPAFINTAWTIQIIRGFVIWFFISIIALFIGRLQLLGFIPGDSVYLAKDLPLVIIVTGFSSVILGFESTKIWLAQRNLTLGKVTRIELLSQLMGISVMIALASRDPTVWSIVIGSLISALFKTLLSHSVLDGKSNYIYLDKKIVLELLHFGKWLFLSAIVTFFALNGDRLLLGGFLKAEDLGFYTVAFFLASALRDLVEKLIFNVWYPLLSRVYRENKETIITVYYKIRLKQDIAVFFFVGFLYVLAPLIIDLLYDSRYKPSGWMLQILVFSLAGSCYKLGSTLMTAVGNPKIGTFAIITRAIALWCFTPISYHYFGISGALWAIAANPLFELPVIWWSFYKRGFICWTREIIFLPFIGVGYYAGLLVLEINTLLYKGL